MVKKRPRAHIIDSIGAHLFKEVLPEEWVVREYRPDYGIDFSVEVFDSKGENFVALGEHFCVQLKSSHKIKCVRKKFRGRYNVEKTLLAYAGERLKAMSVVSVSLETEELQLARSMGPAAPVVLVLADVAGSSIYWVCLNDFVDRVLIPEVGEDRFCVQKTHTVYLPCTNRIDLNSDDDGAFIPLRFLARRAKLYAAFNRFRYQRHAIDLEYARWIEGGPCSHQRDHPDLLDLANHYLGSALVYDFWKTTYAWSVVELTHRDVANTAALVGLAIKSETVMSSLEERHHVASKIQSTFDRLANLGDMFEEICREWFLPTMLGVLAQEQSVR